MEFPCYTLGSHQLSILYIISTVYICQSQSPGSSHSPPTSPLGIHIKVEKMYSYSIWMRHCASHIALTVNNCHKASVKYILSGIYKWGGADSESKEINLKHVVWWKMAQLVFNSSNSQFFLFQHNYSHIFI